MIVLVIVYSLIVRCWQSPGFLFCLREFFLPQVGQVEPRLESGGKVLTSFAFYPVIVLATRAACQACK